MGQASVKPQGYLPRLVDEQVERCLRIFGAVEIEGTKWCGKTWTARQHGASISYVDEELSLAQDDPSLMLMGERPHVIDEWQHVPAIWNLVRHGVDETRGLRGAWILTGSSTPPNHRSAAGEGDKRHSGAGRIGRIKMSPMTLSESGESEKSVSLARLFEEPPVPVIVGGNTEQLVDVTCRGGWPEAVDLSPLDAQAIVREYLSAICYESAPDQGLDPFVAERIIASLARNLGQAATYGTIREDALGSTGDDLADRQIGEYLSFFNRRNACRSSRSGIWQTLRSPSQRSACRRLSCSRIGRRLDWFSRTYVFATSLHIPVRMSSPALFPFATTAMTPGSRWTPSWSWRTAVGPPSRSRRVKVRSTRRFRISNGFARNSARTPELRRGPQRSWPLSWA